MVLMFLTGDGMRGGALHRHIEGAEFLGARRTLPRYRFYSIRDEFPALHPVGAGGSAILGELYQVPMPALHGLLAREPAELELSIVELAPGESGRLLGCHGRRRGRGGRGCGAVVWHDLAARGGDPRPPRGHQPLRRVARLPRAGGAAGGVGGGQPSWITERTLPAGSLNQAMSGPPCRLIPLGSTKS